MIGTSATTTTTVADQLAMFAATTVAISGEAWTVAVADTPALRAQGLMGVTDLGELDGMLFVFESNVSNGFWMKDTPIPLDIAFFDVDGVLVDLLTMTPCRVRPLPDLQPSRGEYRYAQSKPGWGRWDAVDQPELVLED